MIKLKQITDPMTHIYILKDPNTLEIKYIGKSNHPKKRYKQHRNVKDVAQDIFGRTFTEGWMGIEDYIGITSGHMEKMGLKYDEDLHISDIEKGYENNIEPKETANQILRKWKYNE